jgi:magnesium transporter
MMPDSHPHASKEHLSRPLADFLRAGPPPLRIDQTVGQALESIRSAGLEERIFYFYVVDGSGRLSGVVPARTLLTEPLTSLVGEVMMKRVLSLPSSATLLNACEVFILHKFLAIPVVDSEKRFLGIIDVGIFTDEVLKIGQGGNSDQLFQSIGVHVQELRHASPWRAFAMRFPWLTVTMLGGGFCALMAEAFAATLRERVVLSVFLALVLGLSEAVSSQSLALTSQSLPAVRIRWRWLRTRLLRESLTAALLGLLSAGVVVLLVALFWHDEKASLAIGLSVCLSVLSASLLGILIPVVLRTLRCDPKIAAGPITLAVADLFTVSLYLTAARWILG